MRPVCTGWQHHEAFLGWPIFTLPTVLQCTIRLHNAVESCLCWSLQVNVGKSRKSRQAAGHVAHSCYFGANPSNASTASHSHRPATAAALAVGLWMPNSLTAGKRRPNNVYLSDSDVSEGNPAGRDSHAAVVLVHPQETRTFQVKCFCSLICCCCLKLCICIWCGGQQRRVRLPRMGAKLWRGLQFPLFCLYCLLNVWKLLGCASVYLPPSAASTV